MLGSAERSSESRRFGHEKTNRRATHPELRACFSNFLFTKDSRIRQFSDPINPTTPGKE
jgi:hypothetical protein